MTIIRTIHGKEVAFELTELERRNAHAEVERDLCREAALWSIDAIWDEDLEEVFGFSSREFLKSCVDEIAAKMQELIEDAGPDFYDSVLYVAFDEVLQDKPGKEVQT